MRKRSEVRQPDPRQTEIPGTREPDPPASEEKPKSEAKLPDGLELYRGVYFVSCPDCGLKQSVESLKEKLCVRCSCDCSSLVAAIPQKDAPPPKVPMKCQTCGVNLTETTAGLFYPCGHETRKSAKDPIPDKPAPAPAEEKPAAESKPRFERAGTPGAPARSVLQPDPPPAPPKADVGKIMDEYKAKLAADGTVEYVDVTYGQETFTPKPYNTFVIGPFTMRVQIRQGESPAQALDRGRVALRDFAEIEFKRKAEDFLKRLGWLVEKLGEK